MAESGRALQILEQITGAMGSTDSTERDSIITITREHHEIHEGNFYIGNLQTTTMAASSWLDIEMITPSTSTKEIHMYYDFNISGGLAEVVLAELSTSSTYSHGATTISAINHNRLSTKTADMALFTGSTNSAFMTSTMTSTQAILLSNYYVGSTGTNASRNGNGAIRSREEFVLNGGSTTILRIWNRGAAGYGSVSVLWYGSL